MRLSSAGMLGVTLVLALIPLGCGGGERTAPGERTATAARTGSEASTRPATRACRGQLGDVVSSMDALRDRLVAGLTYEQYLAEVREVRDRYDRIPGDQVAIGCLLGVGAPAERALNRYLSAANEWGDCLSVFSCDTEGIEPKLQRQWALASSLLSTAQDGLRG